MPRTAVLIVALLALIAGAWFLTSGDGGDGSGSFEGDAGAPAVVGKDYGAVVPVSDSDGKARYRAVPSLGAFIGWFDDGIYLSGDNELSRASFEGITAMFAESAGKTVSYGWNCPVFDSAGNPTDATVRETFTTTIDRATYYKSVATAGGRTATYAEPMPVHRLTDDAVVDAIASHLSPLTEGRTNLQKAEIVLAFVQDVIVYQSDRDQYGVSEFWALPMETVYSGRGDCEDTATLFVNVALRMGLDAGFVAFDDPVMGHMSAAVALADGETVAGATFSYDGRTYAYAETAVDSRHHVGWLTSSFEITDGKWCHVSCSDEGYVGDETVPIGVKATGCGPFYYGVCNS